MRDHNELVHRALVQISTCRNLEARESEQHISTSQNIAARESEQHISTSRNIAARKSERPRASVLAAALSLHLLQVIPNKFFKQQVQVSLL